jgi:hypothetical protein
MTNDMKTLTIQTDTILPSEIAAIVTDDSKQLLIYLKAGNVLAYAYRTHKAAQAAKRSAIRAWEGTTDVCKV